jgi:hypothetical protein
MKKIGKKKILIFSGIFLIGIVLAGSLYFFKKDNKISPDAIAQVVANEIISETNSVIISGAMADGLIMARLPLNYSETRVIDVVNRLVDRYEDLNYSVRWQQSEIAKYEVVCLLEAYDKNILVSCTTNPNSNQHIVTISWL